MNTWKVIGVGILLGWLLPLTVVADETKSEEALHHAKQLKAKDVFARRQAAKALSDMKADAKPAQPALIESLKDQDLFVKRFAALALGNIGADAKSAIPEITKLLKDEDKEVVAAATEALGSMGAPAASALGDALRMPDPLVKLNAAKQLAKLGTDAKPATNALIDTFKGGTSSSARPNQPRNSRIDPATQANIRAACAEALGNIGPDAKAALPALKESIEGRVRDRSFQQVVQRAIRKIEK
jgi:HEAT repeat protein